MNPSLDKYTDAELLKRYREGDETAFREIVERYKNSLYSFLRRFLNRQDLVEDVFQETFLQLFASRDSFDTSRPLRPWLFTIAANKAKDALRKMQRHSSMSIGAIADSGDVSVDDVINILTSYKTTPDDEVTMEETARRVREVVAEGKIGDVHIVKITSRDPAPPPIDYVKVSGGIFLDMSIHDFDMARYLSFSEVEEVYAQGCVMIDPAIGEVGDIDTAVITLKFKNRRHYLA